MSRPRAGSTACPSCPFRASALMVFFAGNVAQADLMMLARAVAEPLYRELGGV